MGIPLSRIALRGVFFVNAVGASGEHDAFDIPQCLDFLQCHFIGMQFGVNAEFANPSCDQLIVLGSEIQHDDFVCHYLPSFSCLLSRAAFSQSFTAARSGSSI
jgi:hypothetical protein